MNPAGGNSRPSPDSFAASVGQQGAGVSVIADFSFAQQALAATAGFASGFLQHDPACADGATKANPTIATIAHAKAFLKV